MEEKQAILIEIKKFLLEKADSIQKLATEHHKELLGGEKFRSEIIEKYQKYHVEVVRQLAEHLDSRTIKEGRNIFVKLGETLARSSVKDGLTIEEATDGIIFLKQAVWESLKESGILDRLKTQDFYNITQNTGTYVDIVVSKIAFTYHERFKELTGLKEKQKNDFISLASHELKTPVTSVKAYAQVLEKRFSKAGDGESAELIKKMDAQLDKLTSLIGDLLDASKIESGKLQFHKNLFDFNDVVKEVVEEMQRTTVKHKIHLELGETKSIYGDRDRIGQVLVNLLTNAIKYSPNADKIIVRSVAKKDEIMLSVKDFGIGISPDGITRVFEQFYRVTSNEEEVFPGMGLGLYVSSEIVKRHHGKIWVESEKGKGSTFYFTLPLTDKGGG